MTNRDVRTDILTAVCECYVCQSQFDVKFDVGDPPQKIAQCPQCNQIGIASVSIVSFKQASMVKRLWRDGEIARRNSL